MLYGAGCSRNPTSCKQDPVYTGSRYNEHIVSAPSIIDRKVKELYSGLFTLMDLDTDYNSDSKPNNCIVLCRTFHTVQIQISMLDSVYNEFGHNKHTATASK